MTDAPYDDLAPVYAWLVPEPLRTPEGAAAAFSAVTGELAAGARVLDCAAGTGELAVGLALQGFAVAATDASGGMIARARALAAERGVRLDAAACAWEDLGRRGWAGAFDAVLCVGNSLTHAAGRTRRRAALAAMAGVLRPGGLLAVTSRNWELVRAPGSRLEVEDRLAEHAGRAAVVTRHWTIAPGWDEPHVLDVAVALLPGDDGVVETHRERLVFWPFTPGELDADLRAAGFAPVASTFAPDAARYLVTASRCAAGGGAG